MKIPHSTSFLDTHPGEYIREEFLQAGGKSIFEFAMAMQISEKLACEIIVGIQPITPALAESLAKVFGVKSDCWLEMQAAWDSRGSSDSDYANLV
jgi:addiction module HigA family antidote